MPQTTALDMHPRDDRERDRFLPAPARVGFAAFGHNMGVSGGGSLMAFYQAQATTQPPARISRTPAGDPPDLNEFDLPAADGLLTVIPHLGEGAILETRIDPSLINEGDPFSIDPSLDMYDPANGFRMPPQKTTCSEEFTVQYQMAQRKRMERLEAWARQLGAEQEHYKGLMKQPEFESLTADQKQRITRHTSTTPGPI